MFSLSVVAERRRETWTTLNEQLNREQCTWGRKQVLRRARGTVQVKFLQTGITSKAGDPQLRLLTHYDPLPGQVDITAQYIAMYAEPRCLTRRSSYRPCKNIFDCNKVVLKPVYLLGEKIPR